MCVCGRLRAARVLLVHMGGLGAEVAKNLILAGVKSLTMLDPAEVTAAEASCQFFVPADCLGANVSHRGRRLVPVTEWGTCRPLYSYLVLNC